MEELEFYNPFIRLALGVSVDVLRTKLRQKYPEMNNDEAKVEFWLMSKVA